MEPLFFKVEGIFHLFLRLLLIYNHSLQVNNHNYQIEKELFLKARWAEDNKSLEI